MHHKASVTSPLNTLSARTQVAAHNAHRGMLGGEADAALAAGVNVMLWQETTAGICQLQVRVASGGPSRTQGESGHLVPVWWYLEGVPASALLQNHCLKLQSAAAVFHGPCKLSIVQDSCRSCVSCTIIADLAACGKNKMPRNHVNIKTECIGPP